MKKHVWFFNAHPDDLNGGLGLALILKELDDYQIHVVDFTRGERGLSKLNVSMAECAATRVAEERSVCAALGVEPVFLPEIDGESYVLPETCAIIEEMLTQAPPAAVITHWPVDIHADHVMCGAAVLGVIRRKKLPVEVYFYRQNRQSRNMPEDVYLPFDGRIMDLKCELLGRYVCQSGSSIAARLRIEDTYNGYRCGAEFAECYASFQLPGEGVFFRELARLRSQQ